MYRNSGEKSQKQPCFSVFRFYSEVAWRILCALEITRFASIIPTVMMQPEQIKQLIEQGLAGAQANVSGDGQHFEAQVVSDAFAGKTMVQQHQLVYQALGDKMKQEVHALSIRTYTPEQWAQRTSGSA